MFQSHNQGAAHLRMDWSCGRESSGSSAPSGSSTGSRRAVGLSGTTRGPTGRRTSSPDPRRAASRAAAHPAPPTGPPSPSLPPSLRPADTPTFPDRAGNGAPEAQMPASQPLAAFHSGVSHITNERNGPLEGGSEWLSPRTLNTGRALLPPEWLPVQIKTIDIVFIFAFLPISLLSVNTKIIMPNFLCCPFSCSVTNVLSSRCVLYLSHHGLSGVSKETERKDEQATLFYQLATKIGPNLLLSCTVTSARHVIFLFSTE